MARTPTTGLAAPYETRVLICMDCHEEFVFTIAAQQYFAERGITDDPKRCKACHFAHKRQQRESQYLPPSPPSF